MVLPQYSMLEQQNSQVPKAFQHEILSIWVRFKFYISRTCTSCNTEEKERMPSAGIGPPTTQTSSAKHYHRVREHTNSFCFTLKVVVSATSGTLSFSRLLMQACGQPPYSKLFEFIDHKLSTKEHSKAQNRNHISFYLAYRKTFLGPEVKIITSLSLRVQVSKRE